MASALVFDVTADGQPLDGEAAFAVPARQRQVEVVWEGSAPVTGVRVEPDGTASSAIELRNASAEPLTVEAGTTVATETGVEFAFTETVTVPAADAATGAPGAATGAVQAVQAGSGGNVGVGELGGRLPNGVYYSNRMQPAAGGTDKEFPVVDQADLDALIAAAREAAPELAAEAVARGASRERRSCLLRSRFWTKTMRSIGEVGRRGRGDLAAGDADGRRADVRWGSGERALRGGSRRPAGERRAGGVRGRRRGRSLSRNPS